MERTKTFQQLINKIEIQIKDNQLEDLVEILAICDNRNIKLSEKRNRMQQMAQGEYFFHLDDDDTISEDYCKIVIDEIKKLKYQEKGMPDVITYNQFCNVNGKEFIVQADLNCNKLTLTGAGDDKEYKLPTFQRLPWQYHLWRTDKYAKIWRTDSDTNAREDQNWLKKVYMEYPQTQHHIKKVLHYYTFGTSGVCPSTCQ